MITQLQLNRSSIQFALLVHLGLGVLVVLFPGLTYFWQLLVMVAGIIQILSTNNRNDIAAVWAAYLSGMEVIMRMTGGSIFWELGKYGVVFFLLSGMTVSGKKFRNTYLLYFLLLLPSILIAKYSDWSQARDMISFNLSGPLCLAVAAMYFHGYRVPGRTILMMVRAFVLPVLVMLVYMVVRTPDFSQIKFSVHSNVLASGGFGPNQVSLVLGVCIFFFIAFQFYNISITGRIWIDYLMIFILAFRALITLSRGGVIGTVLALATFILATTFLVPTGRRLSRIIWVLILVVGAGVLVWDYSNEVTNESLAYRYIGINPRTGKEQEYTTGRLLILQRDVRLFLENPMLGTGPGTSMLATKELKGKEVAAHTEWSRMLAEHGMPGLVALLVLFLAPIAHILSLERAQRPLLLAIYVLAMFSMFHAAMRLAIIGLLYGLALQVPSRGSVKMQ